jgi:hypothetical protein
MTWLFITGSQCLYYRRGKQYSYCGIGAARNRIILMETDPENIIYIFIIAEIIVDIIYFFNCNFTLQIILILNTDHR